MSLSLGAIADDFTGATDLANTLVKEGMRVVQTIGVPTPETETGDAEAVVVALKSRTAPGDEAVSDSLASLAWLRGRGAQQVVSKYCSTFDSTAQGNIGPIADALMEGLETDFAFVCPAFPANGRTVYQGHLFVGEALLSKSSMKDHPLTPMRDSNLVSLMAAQSQKRVGLIPLSVVREGPSAIKKRVADLITEGISYGIIDALTDDDLRVIGVAARSHALVTGGSGVAMGLPANLQNGSDGHRAEVPRVKGRALVLAGSCSAATRAQIERVQDRWPTRKIDVAAIAEGTDVVTECTDWALSQPADQPVLIYSSADPNEVAQTQKRYGTHKAGAMVERTLSAIASRLTAGEFKRLIAAGGETSGAIVSALNVSALRIGPEIAPGVPWTESLGTPQLALALKSGNFGGERFFEDAFGMLP